MNIPNLEKNIFCDEQIEFISQTDYKKFTSFKRCCLILGVKQ